MATGEQKTVSVIPLSDKNYATWKVQCQMALMKDGLWNIVNGTELPPPPTDNGHTKFMARRDRALATIVLSVDPSLLYLIGDPVDPIVVWKKLADQFQKRSWANKLELRRKLYSLRLKDGESVQKHVKDMTEIFNGLSVIGDPVSDEDRVVYLLASLPDSYSMLVTALEANEEVPKMEVVTERLLHEERKLKDRAGVGESSEKVMTARRQSQKYGPKCHQCGKFGHIKRNCWELVGKKSDLGQKEVKNSKYKVNKAEVKQRNSDSSSSESAGLVVSHALSGLTSTVAQQNSWIVDSGATCHMCNDSEQFVELHSLEQPHEVTLGDGHVIKSTMYGTVALSMRLPDGKVKRCKLYNALYVPKLSYNLLSVSRATQSGKTTEFNETSCRIVDEGNMLIAVATKVGSLYYLDCESSDYAHVAEKSHGIVEKEDLWHRRYGHLGLQNLKKLAKNGLVEGFNYNPLSEITFCEPCAEGKHHRSHFPTSSSRSDEPLGLVHSDVCGKMNTQSLSGAEYFLTFIDDKTRYAWIYVLKHKHEVFDRFLEWKAMVEKSTGHKLKVLRTDNGGEYTSEKFENYLKTEGVRHELTVPRTPEQNGVAERMNRTLVEAVRTMLADSKLPQQFWAEALSTAVYLRNRSPAKAVDVTPFEAWTGTKPRVEHLRVFGCSAYAHIAKEERQKLDFKAKGCILLGYGTATKGYRLYDPKHEKVFYSRDVVFNENVCGFHDELDKGEQRHDLVTFDCQHDTESDVDEQADSVLRRSARQRHPPSHYGEWTTVADAALKEPTTVTEALTRPDKAKWLNAMRNEIESLNASDVWDLVELPKDRKAVGSKWVFKLKFDADGVIERHKARLVAQGFSQKFGVDYDETFCPVVRHESIRTLIALAVQNELKLHQMDITTAFLNGELKEEVYMKQPEGFISKGQEHLVCRLKRSIYGLKQSPRCWNRTLDEELKKLGFVQSANDPCIYVATEGEKLVIAVYVDDLILAGKTDEQIARIKSDLCKRFNAKDMGELHYFLGMKIIQNQSSGEVWIGQPVYTQNILEKFGMKDAKPVSTPVDVSSKLVTATAESSDSIDQDLYQSAVGSLLYLSVATRPDIAFAVSNVAKYCASPSKQHWIAVKRIMRYLKGTSNYGLCYIPSHHGQCIGFSDADWAGDTDDRKSTSGYMFQISGAAVSWRSKKQTCVALSTAEAEYVALSNAAQEAIWLRQLLTDMRSDPVGATVILEDNQSAISMTKNPQYHGRAKHIDIKYHFVHDLLERETIQLKYCCSEDMIADILTKGLPREQFTKLRELSGVREPN